MKMNLPIESMLYTPDSKPFGLSFSQWTVRWWRWLLSSPNIENPAVDKSGSYSKLSQENKNVWFLAGTFGGFAERECKVPAGKSILMPIINYECSFADEPSITTIDELELKCQSEIDDIKNLVLIIDDFSICNLHKYRVRSPIFQVRLQEQNILGANPGPTKMITDGFWIFLKPLEIGTHKLISTGSCRSGKIKIGTKYILQVS
jgi:hypothetical protein